MNSKNNDILIVILIIGLVLFFTGLPKQKFLLNKNITLSSTALPTPTPFKTPSKEVQKWLIATTGILTVQNREGFDSLKSQIPLPDLKTLVKEWWGVEDRKDALDTITWLRKEGHREEFDMTRQYLLMKVDENNGSYEKAKKDLLSKLKSEEIERQSFLLDFVWEHKNDLTSKSLLAWDYMRLNSIARWCYTLGLISEQEAWETMFYSSQKLQTVYSSWNDLGENYLLGRTFWQAYPYHPDAQNSLYWLRNNPASPWKNISWSLELR